MLLIGLALGLAAGLGYAWGLDPIEFYNNDPVDLHPAYKETWILLVAATYRQDGDLDRAMIRLDGLKDPQIGQTVADLTERYIQAGKSATRIHALASLADALGARTADMMIYLTTPEPALPSSPTPQAATATATPSPTAPQPTATPTASPTAAPDTSTPHPTSTATATPRPTITLRPTPTTPPPYRLQERQLICQADQETPRIEIFVQTEKGDGIPGSEIWVTWSGGVDYFVTGLKPEIGLGYADFNVTPDTAYAVAVSDPTLQVVDGLRTEPCQTDEGDAALASWRLIIAATQDAFTPTPTLTPSLTPSPRTRATSTPTQAPTQTRTIP